jgi:NAD+-dependent secondary alcohol dehydrogenase Adh1
VRTAPSPASTSTAGSPSASERWSGGDGAAARVKDVAGETGVEAVLNFVGEHGTSDLGPAMLRQGGTYFVIGYGGRVELPAIEVISREISVVGNLVGSYTQLTEPCRWRPEGRSTSRPGSTAWTTSTGPSMT